MRRAILSICVSQLILLVFFAGTSFGQSDAVKPDARTDNANSFSLFGPEESSEGDLTPSAQFTVDGTTTKLWVTAKLTPGWHTYSITQPESPPIRTLIKVTASKDFKVGEFTPTVPPLSHAEPAFDNRMVEEHDGEVTWWAPLHLQPGVDPAKLEIAGHIYAQICSKSCIEPKDYPFVAKLATSAPKSGSDTLESVGGTLSGVLEPSSVAPGGKAQLKFTFIPADGFHVYASNWDDPESLAKNTIIALGEIQGLHFGRPVASDSPTSQKFDENINFRFYRQPVTWTVDVDVAADAPKGPLPIAGVIGYLNCSDVYCDHPRGARFVATIDVGSKTAKRSAPISFSEATYADAARLDAAQQSAHMPLPLVILFSLVGGAILNLMPCVLPVIGLKILSFVEQAGQHRRQILALNLWYSAGLITVFLVLASLAVFLNLGWGQQFSSTAFNVVMSAVVFVMALSFLGVWEIPIPGFVGSGKSNELAAREGASGAFAKGVLTTVLATPCSGPFLGSVFGFTLKQPPGVTFLIFACIGLGMASPYLLIGAFPRLIRFLPKPGAWMDTFKQLMGFVLLGTVVFMFTFINRDYLVPTFALLVGLWLGCWWIGRTPLTMEFGQKARAWGLGLTAATAVGVFAFTMLTPQVMLIAWQPFSKQALADHSKDGKTVIVDFTADWCLTCKANMRFAINTVEVRDAVEENKIVPLLADWTSGSAEVKSMLATLDSKSIPLLAIFPASRPDRPIILRDVVTTQQILDAIKAAGPSVADSPEVAANNL